MTRGGDPRVLHRRVIGVGVADLTSASVAVPARNGPVDNGPCRWGPA